MSTKSGGDTNDPTETYDEYLEPSIFETWAGRLLDSTPIKEGAVTINSRIRPCETSDVQGVVKLWRESDDLGGSTNDEETVLRRLAFTDGLFLLAERNKTVVGTIIGGWDGWRGSIYRLVVAESERRRGIGKQLVASTLDRLKAFGATRVYALVQVEEHSPVATPFWVSQGFSPADTVNPYVLSL